MSKFLSNHFPSLIVFALFIGFGSLYLFSNYMDTYPSYVHAWTQTDRLALAQNFQENGFDLFHPATYNLLTKDGITQVDFPIHDYLVAVVSATFKTNMVSTFRWYNLLYSILGIFFFYKTVLILSQSPKRAVFTAIFLFTLPFYAYYANGFLPSIPSFSNFLIGLYFLSRFKEKQAKSMLFLASLFFCLAALSRIPFVIFLLALIGDGFFNKVYFKKGHWGQFLIPLVCIIPIIAYYLYNKHLANTYGSMFLSELLYIDSFSSLVHILYEAWDRWSNQLFSPFHYLTLFVFFILYFKNRSTKSNRWKAFFALSSIGVVAFFFAMGQQLIDHDYYYIDILLPILVIGLLIIVPSIQFPKRFYTALGTLFIIFSFYFFSYGKQILDKRYTPPYDDRIEYAYRAYQNSKTDLANWGITQEDTLLVLDAVTTNMPFTIWGNKGYTLLNSSEDAVRESFKNDFDYVVLLDSNFVSGTWVDFPRIIYHLDLVAKNKQLGVYKKTADTNQVSFFQNLVHFGTADFDQVIELDSNATAWMNTKQVDTTHGLSYYTPKNYEYFLSSTISLNQIDSANSLEVMVHASYFSPSDTTKVQLIMSHGNYYGAHYLESQIVAVGEWQDYLYRFRIPSEKLEADKPLKLYYWNPHQQELYIDDLNILIYQ